MGLLDGYFDPDQFGEGGGLLGRLLALQQVRGLYPPRASDPQPAATGQTPAMPQASMLAQSAVPSPGAAPVELPFAALASGIAGLRRGHPTDRAGLAQQTLQQRTESYGNSASSDNGPAGLRRASGSVSDGQPPNLSKVGYFELPTNANQAFGEISDIQERNRRDTVSREDYVSGVREGNVSYNPDGSLDVTNGTVVTFSYKNGRAKTVTVTKDDIAHIDGKTGDVVIKKSSLGKGI